MTRLSVILPTFEGARFLDEQIESVLAQTDPDFELLAIDDGSRDDSAAILAHHAHRDPRVRVLAATGNQGHRLRLRELAELATGEFVAIADQDDIWHPERNARLLAAIGKCAIAFGRSQLVDIAGADQGRSILEALGVDAGRTGRLAAFFQPLVSGHAAIVRRSWLDLAAFVGPCPFDFVLGLAASWSDGLVYDDDALVYHRIHGGNQSNAGVTSPEKIGKPPFLDRLAFFLSLDQLGRSRPLDREVRRTLDLAAAKCRWTWFERLDVSTRRARALHDDLLALLLPHASSPDDAAAFAAAIREMTRPSLAPARIAGRLAGRFGR